METRKNPPRKALKKRIKSNAAGMRLRRVVNVSHGFSQAREWEILQEISMTPAQRQRAAKALKERFYGKNRPDVRAAHSSR
jgi:dienelactone hydrolase